MFLRNHNLPLFRFTNPVISTISLDAGLVHLHAESFHVRDVMVAVINFDPSPEGEVYGSAVFKTREFDHVNGAIQSKYSLSFDGTQLTAAREVANAINAAGGSVKYMAIGDGAFRHTFFDD